VYTIRHITSDSRFDILMYNAFIEYFVNGSSYLHRISFGERRILF